APSRLGSGKERKAFAGAALHLHDVRDDVNSGRKPRIEGEGATRHRFSTVVLAVLLESEGVHCKDAGVAGRGGIPRRQHLGDTIPQHVPLAEAEVERMRDHERQNVAWPVDDDGAVTLSRQTGVALEPSTRRIRMTTRRSIDVCTRRLYGGYAGGKRGSR